LIRKYLKKEVTIVKETSVHSWQSLEAPPKFQNALLQWKKGLNTVTEWDGSTKAVEQRQAAINFITRLWDKLDNAPDNPQVWKSILQTVTASAQQHQIQLDAISEACEQASLTSGFTVDRKFPILKSIKEELDLQRLIGSELSRKRPDGLAVNWKKRQFFILEFTRAYDADPKFTERADNYKIRKYRNLCDSISRALGASWSGEVMPFTVIRGGIHLRRWSDNLERLGLNEVGIKDITTLASKITLEQCHFMYQAREAALKSLGDCSLHSTNTIGDDRPRLA
jgi:hypothetical protein